MSQGFRVRSLRRLARCLRPGFIATSLLLIFCGLEAAHATTLFGILSSGSAGDAISGQKWNTDVFQNVLAYSSPVLSYSDSYQSVGATVSDNATAWFSSDGNGGLHGYASAGASVNNTDASQNTGEAGASFNSEWVDTLYVIGLPVGTPVQIQLTNVLDSITNFSGADAVGGVEESASLSDSVTGANVSSSLTNTDGEPYTPSNGVQSQTLVLNTKVGDALQLTLQLNGNALNGGIPAGTLSATALADASDTANVYFTVLTPGASYTTASGINYASQSTPEPGTLWLMATALAGIRAARRRSTRRS
jgi:PEP-CTERM motif